MKSLSVFNTLRDTEEFFRFFELEFDVNLVQIKRFHIMRKFGEMIAKIDTNIQEESRLLELYKFALITVYKNFEKGYSPSAAEVWDMFGRPNPCLECATMSSCDSKGKTNENPLHTC